MKIQIFCFSLLVITAGVLYAAKGPTPMEVEEPKPTSDFTPFADQPEEVLKNIASSLSDTSLARFGEASRRLHTIAQAELETRLSYRWATGTIIQKPFHAHEGSVYSVFVSNDGNIVSVGEKDKRIYIWQWNGKTYQKMRLMTDDVNRDIWHAAFSPITDRLVLRHSDGITNVWDVQAGTKFNQCDLGQGGRTVLFPDGTTLAVLPRNGIIELWNLGTCVPKKINTHLRSMLFEPAISPDGKKIAFREEQLGPIDVWNLETSEQENQFTFNERDVRLAFLPGGKLIAYRNNSYAHKFFVWDVETLKQISMFDYDDFRNMQEIVLSQNGNLFAGWSQWRSKIVIWNLESGKIVRELLMTRAVTRLAFSPDDKMLVASCENGDIYTYQAMLPEKKEAQSKK